jgi:hypothetical protein
MAVDDTRLHPLEASEGDALEQDAPLSVEDPLGEQTPDSEDAVSVSPFEANDADAVEQRQVVPLGDDEYP